MADRPDHKTHFIQTCAGIFVIVALVILFAIEMTNPETYVLQDRTIYILLTLIAALLGLNQFGGSPNHRPDGGEVVTDKDDTETSEWRRQ